MSNNTELQYEDLPFDVLVYILEYYELSLEIHAPFALYSTTSARKRRVMQLCYGYSMFAEPRQVQLVFKTVSLSSNVFYDCNGRPLIPDHRILDAIPTTITILRMKKLEINPRLFSTFQNLQKLDCDIDSKGTQSTEELYAPLVTSILCDTTQYSKLSSVVLSHVKKLKLYQDELETGNIFIGQKCLSQFVPNLQILTIEYWEDFNNDFSLFAGLNHLTELYLHNTRFNLALGDSFTLPPTLRRLGVAGIIIGTFSKSFVEHKLEYLNIAKASIEKELCLFTSDNSTLEEIVVCRPNCGQKANHIFEACSKLTKLTIQNMTTSMMQFVLQENPILSSLVELNISLKRISLLAPVTDCAIVELVVSHATRAEKLDLGEHRQLSVESISFLAQHPHLTDLSVRQCRLDQECIKLLLESKSIKILNVSGNELPCYNSPSTWSMHSLTVSDISDNELKQILQENRSITHLELLGNIDESVLISALKNNSTLTSLTCQVYNSDKVVVEIYKNNPNLRKINVTRKSFEFQYL